MADILQMTSQRANFLPIFFILIEILLHVRRVRIDNTAILVGIMIWHQTEDYVD